MGRPSHSGGDMHFYGYLFWVKNYSGARIAFTITEGFG